MFQMDSGYLCLRAVCLPHLDADVEVEQTCAVRKNVRRRVHGASSIPALVRLFEYIMGYYACHI